MKKCGFTFFFILLACIISEAFLSIYIRFLFSVYSFLFLNQTLISLIYFFF